MASWQQQWHRKQWHVKRRINAPRSRSISGKSSWRISVMSIWRRNSHQAAAKRKSTWRHENSGIGRKNKRNSSMAAHKQRAQ